MRCSPALQCPSRNRSSRKPELLMKRSLLSPDCSTKTKKKQNKKRRGKKPLGGFFLLSLRPPAFFIISNYFLFLGWAIREHFCLEHFPPLSQRHDLPADQRRRTADSSGWNPRWYAGGRSRATGPSPHPRPRVATRHPPQKSFISLNVSKWNRLTVCSGFPPCGVCGGFRRARLCSNGRRLRRHSTLSTLPSAARYVLLG